MALMGPVFAPFHWYLDQCQNARIWPAEPKKIERFENLKFFPNIFEACCDNDQSFFGAFDKNWSVLDLACSVLRWISST